MNTEKIPLSITIVSQIKDIGPFVGVIERYGEEVYRTFESYKTTTAAYHKCWEKLNPAEVEFEKQCERDFERVEAWRDEDADREAGA